MRCVATWSVLAFTLMLSVESNARATPTFFEGFDGAFSQTWNSGADVLPAESLQPFRNMVVRNLGPPEMQFTTVEGASVLRLHTTGPPSWTRYGLLSAAEVSGAGELEARFNTLDQGNRNIDGLFDLWLVNASDRSKYVRVGLFGDEFDSIRSWNFSTSNDIFRIPAFAYQSNTWYRMRITQPAEGNLSVSVWNDNGNTQLAAYTFPYALDSLGSSFHIGFSQWMGGPNLDTVAALDSIQFSVPEPSAGALILLGAWIMLQGRTPITGRSSTNLPHPLRKPGAGLA